jgi:hypothetical protein
MPPEGSDLVFDHRHNAEMSELIARISMRVPEYSFKLSRPPAHHSAAFSIVLAGNQIADYELVKESVRGSSAASISTSSVRVAWL